MLTFKKKLIHFVVWSFRSAIVKLWTSILLFLTEIFLLFKVNRINLNKLIILEDFNKINSIVIQNVLFFGSFKTVSHTKRCKIVFLCDLKIFGIFWDDSNKQSSLNAWEYWIWMKMKVKNVWRYALYMPEWHEKVERVWSN